MKALNKKAMSRKFKNVSKKAQELGFLNVREALKAGYEKELKRSYAY